MPTEHNLDTVRLRGILSAAVDGIIQINASGKIEEFNPAAERIFGYSASEVIGDNVSCLMTETDRSRHDHYVQNYIETRVPKIIGIGRLVTGLRKNGEEFPMRLAVGEILTDEGEHLFVGMVRDVTEQQRIQEKLTRSERQLTIRWEHAPIPMAAVDAEGSIIRVNPAASAFWGRSASELTSLPLEELVHSADLDIYQGALRSLVSRASQSLQFRLRFAHPDKSLLHATVHCTGLFDEENELREILAQVVDRTAEVAAELEAGAHRERLAHATRIGTMGELAAGIAHEVNQPLTAISVYASACQRILESDPKDPPVLLDALTKIHDQALRAGEVIRRLRSFVSKRESERELVDVNEAIREVVQLASTETRAVDFAVITELTDGLPPSRIDAIQIQQVLLNLIRNGKEAMQGVAQPEEEIHITSRQNLDGQIEVSVTDRGNGISPEAEQALFDPFFTTKHNGMGMGLSISRSIIAAHGGKLVFQRNKDRGTRFYFTLPVTLGVEQ